jgi:cell division transport system ATP-binding protein
LSPVGVGSPLTHFDVDSGGPPIACSIAVGETRSQNSERETVTSIGVGYDERGVVVGDGAGLVGLPVGLAAGPPSQPLTAARASARAITTALTPTLRMPPDCQTRLRRFRIAWPIALLSNAMIRFEKVVKSYPGQGHPALDHVTVDVEKGEFVFLVGASGSGKSTALRLVLRETRPTEGRVYVAGKEINRLAGWKVPRLRRQIGTVFQDFRLLPNKTVSENVAFALQVIGKGKAEIKSLVPETLELVGLDGKGDRLPDELSGGEQQRVAIARAFVNRPMILIADEPTGNLDPTTSVGIMKLLDRINRTGTTVLMATHDAGVVDQMRKRVIELDAGRVIRDQSQGVYGFQN